MNSEQLWNLFCDTGDPMCWLCYQAAKKRDNGTDTR